MKLSERQQHMLVFIQEYYQEHLYPPTIREIGEAVGISSTSVVNYNLNKLVDAGMIQRNKDVSRGIRLTNAPRSSLYAVSQSLATSLPDNPSRFSRKAARRPTRSTWPPTCWAGPKKSHAARAGRLDDRCPGR